MTGGAQPLYLGVDAGNSKTVAVLADRSGRVVGYGRAGCGDIYGTVTEDAAVAEVMAAVRAAVAMASSSVETTSIDVIAHAAFCLAGIDWTADELYWREQLARWMPGLRDYSLRNDGFALLRAGEPTGVGVAVSAGTGAAIVGRGPLGKEWSASMWIVDALGGAALGEQAYTAVVRAELGLAPPTELRDVVLTGHGFSEVDDLLEAFTRRAAERPRHARLARGVLDAASAGDAVATGIVDTQASTFARYTEVVAKKVGLVAPELTVVLGGSVMTSVNAALRDATRQALDEVLPGARCVLTPRSPVLGAVGEAIAEGTGELSAEVVDRLSASRFPPEFLHT